MIPNNKNNDTKNHKHKKKKTVEELRIQWKGGSDVWPKVPLLPGKNHLNTNKSVSIQTRVKANDDDNDKNVSCSNSSDINKPKNQFENDAQAPTHKRTLPWPQIIQEYTLFGFGAYNPRGQEAPSDVNERQHDLLRQDIQSALSRYTIAMATYWDSAAVWEDGSSEPTFILAFHTAPFNDTKEQAEESDDSMWRISSSSLSSPSSSSLHVQEGLKLSIELARKYDQGAIYKYEYKHDFPEMGRGGRLIRDTIAVMDEGSEATVEVEIDPDCIEVDF